MTAKKVKITYKKVWQVYVENPESTGRFKLSIRIGGYSKSVQAILLANCRLYSNFSASFNRREEFFLLRTPQAAVKLKYSLKVHHSVRETKQMPAVEIGRICMKQKGRETGKRCVIIDVMDKSFVLVTGPKKITGVKRRRVNIAHLQLLQEKIDISRSASDEEITAVLESTGKPGTKTRAKK